MTSDYDSDVDLIEVEQVAEEVTGDFVEEAPIVEVENNAQTEDQPNEAEPKPVKPKRVVKNPQPKLNAQTLKGSRGLEAIEGYFDRVKFKGHGYEEQDLNVIMKTYEYWCHRLFPKFPFNTCIERLETLGHKRATQTHIKRIRYNLIFDENRQIDSDKEDENMEGFVDIPDNQFDQLISSSNPSSAATSTELTEEQLERMRLNREKAEYLRQEKLRSVRERAELHLAESSRLPSTSGQDNHTIALNQNIIEDEEMEATPSSPSNRKQNNLDSESEDEVEVSERAVCLEQEKLRIQSCSTKPSELPSTSEQNSQTLQLSQNDIENEEIAATTSLSGRKQNVCNNEEAEISISKERAEHLREDCSHPLSQSGVEDEGIEATLSSSRRKYKVIDSDFENEPETTVNINNCSNDRQEETAVPLPSNGLETFSRRKHNVLDSDSEDEEANANTGSHYSSNCKKGARNNLLDEGVSLSQNGVDNDQIEVVPSTSSRRTRKVLESDSEDEAEFSVNRNSSNNKNQEEADVNCLLDDDIIHKQRVVDISQKHKNMEQEQSKEIMISEDVEMVDDINIANDYQG